MLRLYDYDYDYMHAYMVYVYGEKKKKYIQGIWFAVLTYINAFLAYLAYNSWLVKGVKT